MKFWTDYEILVRVPVRNNFFNFVIYNLPCLCLGKLCIGIRSHYMVTINYVIGFPTGL